MIERCAEAITVWLINNGVIEENEEALYMYATYSFFVSVAPLFIAIIFGILAGQVVHSIIIIIPFMVIRKFSGGYHTKHPWSCMICSSILLLFCIYISSNINWNVGFEIVTIVSIGSLLAFSPIDSENRRLDVSEKTRYRKLTSYLTGLFTVLIAVLYLLKLRSYAICISIGLILTAGLQVPCIWRKYILKK